ncbi:hypothetical protein LCGC14_1657070 [marine sediment metagenome]|uniref:Uncharacterized protein n=1 Tax=marine sediment metagenome TaxID=412755 RepID=A0A0F9IHK2_9ZZZZ
MINLSDYDLVPHKTDSVKVGQIYGMFTVLAIGKSLSKKRALIIVQCSCGNPPKKVEMNNLKAGKSTSCGCVNKKIHTTHGFNKHPLHARWLSMMYRCENPKFPGYDRYGARGIKVCERWHDIRNFIEDMNDTFRKYLQIERIDNDGDYTPNNCKWGTRSEQALNRHTCHKITFQGRTMSISEWSKETGIKYNCLSSRILNQGMSPEEALTRPVLTHEESARNALKCRWDK